MDYEIEVKQKRERSANFSQEETDLLVTIADTKKHIIESKKTGATAWQEKEKAWKEIEEAFNHSSDVSVYRNYRHLKMKYECMKREIKRKSSTYSGKILKIAPLTPAEERVKKLILSVEGNENYFDADSSLPNTSTYDSTVHWMSAKEENVQQASEQDIKRDFSKEIVVEVEIPQSVEHDDDSHESLKEVPYQCAENNQYKKPKTTNTAAFKRKKNLTLSKIRKNKHFHLLVEENIEISKIRKKILTEELNQKFLHRKLLQKELEQKAVMHELQKQQLLLQIELLRKNLKEK